MREFFLGQMDYVFFVYGLAFFVLFTVCVSLRKQDGTGMPWRWLGLFGLVHGAAESLDMLAISLGDSEPFKWVRLGVMALSFVFLLEFGRGSLQRLGIKAGRWLYLPAILLIALESGSGLPALNAACRYTLGFPGAVLSGAAFVLTGARQKDGSGRWKIFTGMVLGLYAFLSGCITPRAPVVFSVFLNHDTFFAATGVPVQVFRMLAALAIAFGVWREDQRLKETPRWVFPVVGLVFILAGFLMVNARAMQVDQRVRHDLKEKAFLIARTVDPNSIKALDFTIQDRARPAYRRLRAQMTLLGEAAGLRSIYTMAMRDGHIVFGPENIPEGSPQASLPGTVYQEPRPEDLAIFRTKEPYVIGPAQDEYGTFISASAPVLDVRSGDVLCVIGIDVDASAFQADIFRYRLAPIMVTGLLMAWTLAGFALMYFFAGATGRRERWARRTPGIMVVILGIMVATVAGWLAQEKARADLQAMLQVMVEERGAALRDELHTIKEFLLPRLVQIMEQGGDLSREDFRASTAPLLKEFLLAGCGWAPRVASLERAAFEAAQARVSSDGFSIYSRGPDGRRVTAGEQDEYWPLLYVEPYDEIKSAVGFDISSNPERRAAAGTAVTTGLMTASDPVRRVSNNEEAVNVYMPVRGSGAAPRGVVYLTWRPQAILQKISARVLEEGRIHMMLFQLAEAEKPPRLLGVAGRYIRPGPGDEDHLLRMSVPVAATCPLFYFGKVYILQFHADTVLSVLLLFQGWIAFGIVLAMAVFAAVLVHYGMNRQADLEVAVRHRTRQLIESEASYRRQFAGNSVPMLLIEPRQGILLEANEAARKFYGYPEGAMNGLSMSQINVLPGEVALRKMRQVLTGDQRHVEFRHRLADGTVTEVAVSVSAIEFGGRPVIHAIVQDISDRKKKDEQIHRLLRALEQSPVTVVITDIDGAIMYANARASVTSGYANEELIGRNSHVFKSGEMSPENYRQLWETIRQGREWHGEFHNKKKGGELYWEFASISPVKDPSGNVTHYIAVKEDITARKKLEEELKRSREAALAASLAKSNFLANMSHEIRTPMNAILGFAGLLEKTRLEERQAAYLRTIKSSGEILMALIDDILDISKIEAGKTELDAVDFDLEPLVRDVVRIMEVKALEKSLALSLAVDPAAAGWFTGDPVKIRQILLNLISNSIKFTEKGGVTIRVAADPAVRAGEERQGLLLVIRDTGIGMSSEGLDKIFQSFSQVDASITRRFGGTGLGLTIARAFARRMGGDITVLSEEGKGSAFTVSLVLEKSKVHSLPATKHGATDAGEEASLAGLRVLVVEDAAPNRELMAVYLDMFGCVRDQAVNGREAVDKIRVNHYDVCFMDVQMPEMDGFQATRIIRRGLHKDIPIVALTAAALTEDRAQALESGMNDFLTKPIDVAQLKAAILKWGKCRA